MSSRILIPQERISTIKKKRISRPKVTLHMFDQLHKYIKIKFIMIDSHKHQQMITSKPIKQGSNISDHFHVQKSIKIQSLYHQQEQPPYNPLKNLNSSSKPIDTSKIHTELSSRIHKNKRVTSKSAHYDHHGSYHK